jgi:hypothetical protein
MRLMPPRVRLNRQRIPVDLRTFLIRNQLLSLLLLASITSCSTGQIPKWDGKIYAGDSAHDGVTRAQENEFISARSPEFDQGIWLSYADFRSFYATYVLGCAQWKPGTSMMSASEALNRFKILMTDLQREANADGSVKQ